MLIMEGGPDGLGDNGSQDVEVSVGFIAMIEGLQFFFSVEGC
jgi:hypothetical protein